MTPYDPLLIQQVLAIARGGDFAIYPGVYAALVGPNYETRAEYRLLRRIGADVVGMSTVPEATVAARLGMRVLALSAVTNVCRPDQPRATTAAGRRGGRRVDGTEDACYRDGTAETTPR